MTGSRILLTAARGGRRVTVGHATGAELARLAGTVDPGSARDMLDAWSLVAIRGPGAGKAAVHALGFRMGLLNTWITSALIVVDDRSAAVATASGNAYALGRRDGPGLHPEMRSHLAYALRTWGFDDVR